jgi:hypothetical protein
MSVKLFDRDRLSRAAGGGILGASHIILVDDFGLSLVVQFECIRTKRYASPATNTSLLINFDHIYTFLLIK